MIKSEFEKRHGKIQYSNAVVHWPNETTKKYNMADEDQPAHIWYIVQNMPESHFGRLNLQSIQTIFKYLAQEPRKPVRDYYLGVLDHRFFSDGWGWFSRHGYGLSTSDRNIYQIPEEERNLAVKVLKCLKNGFKKFNFKPKYSDAKYINKLITEYGGTLMTKSDLEQAIQKIKIAEKLPRKLKKQVKKGFFEKLFANKSK